MIPLHVIPISDGRSRELHRVLDDIFPELDESGGDLIYWDDIGSPLIRGPVYEASVSRDQLANDDAHAQEYFAEVAALGGRADLYAWREIEILAREFDLQARRPALAVRLPYMGLAELSIPRKCLLGESQRDALKKIILASVTKKSATAELRKHAWHAQEYLNGLIRFLEEIAEDLHRVHGAEEFEEPVVAVGDGTYRFPYLENLLCSTDFRHVRYQGAAYRFSAEQAKVIETLLCESRYGRVSVRQNDLSAKSIWDLFKRHPALDGLFRSSGSGFWSLVSQTDESEPASPDQ